MVEAKSGKGPRGSNRPAAEDGVQEVLDALGRALTAGDGEAVADLWNLPAYVLGDTMARTVEMREELVEFFGSAKEQYAELGVRDTRAEVTRVEWLTERIAQVEVRWPYLDADGQERGDERSIYTLRRDDAGNLAICVAVALGGSAPS
jgi:hypothetical protein